MLNAIVNSRIRPLLLNDQIFRDQICEHVLNICDLAFDFLLHQPPLNNAFECVLRLSMLHHISEYIVGQLRFFDSTHSWSEALKLLRQRSYGQRLCLRKLVDLRGYLEAGGRFCLSKLAVGTASVAAAALQLRLTARTKWSRCLV